MGGVLVEQDELRHRTRARHRAGRPPRPGGAAPRAAARAPRESGRGWEQGPEWRQAEWGGGGGGELSDRTDPPDPTDPTDRSDPSDRSDLTDPPQPRQSRVLDLGGGSGSGGRCGRRCLPADGVEVPGLERFADGFRDETADGAFAVELHLRLAGWMLTLTSEGSISRNRQQRGNRPFMRALWYPSTRAALSPRFSTGRRFTKRCWSSRLPRETPGAHPAPEPRCGGWGQFGRTLDRRVRRGGFERAVGINRDQGEAIADEQSETFLEWSELAGGRGSSWRRAAGAVARPCALPS